MEKFLTWPWFWWIAAGACLGIAQLHPLAWPLTLVGVALAVLAADRTKKWKAVMWGGLILGTLKCFGGFAWIWSAYPITWLEIDSLAMQFCLVGLYWFTTSVFMGAGMVLPALAAWHWRRRSLALCLIFPVAFVAGEVLGSFLVSLWLLGPGGYPNIYIGHGYAGLPLSQLNLLWPVMALAGLYGLTYLVALVGAIVSRTYYDQKPMIVCLIALVAFVLALQLMPLGIEDQSIEARVAVVDTSFTTTMQDTAAGRALKGREVMSALEQALETSDSDFLLLPEDSRFTSLFDTPEEALEYLQTLGTSTVVVDSARTDVGNGQVALRAYYYDLGSKDIYMTDKQFLVPQGEYVTYPFRALLRLTGQGGFLAGIDQNQNYVPGPIKGYEDFPADLPAMLFCSESSSVLGVKEATRLVFHPVSHARFHDSEVLKYQLSSMLRTQAIWSNVTIVTAGNMTESRVYKADGSVGTGRVLAETPYWRLIGYDL